MAVAPSYYKPFVIESATASNDRSDIWLAHFNVDPVKEKSNVYGQGKDIDRALTDYKISLIEYYELVRENSEEFPLTKVICDRLREYIGINE